MSEKLTVAELLARNAKEGGRAERPRRRRTLEEGGVSVSELTGSIPVVRDEDIEHDGAHQGQDADAEAAADAADAAPEQVEAAQPTVQDAQAEPVVEVQDEAVSGLELEKDVESGTPAEQSYPGLFSHDTDDTTIIPVAGEDDPGDEVSGETTGDLSEDVADAEAPVFEDDLETDTGVEAETETFTADADDTADVDDAADSEEDSTSVFPSVGATAAGATAAGATAVGVSALAGDRSESVEGAAEFSGDDHETDAAADVDVASDEVAADTDAAVDTDADVDEVEAADDEIIEYEDDAVSWPAMIGQAALAVVVGVIIFFGFTLLWDKLAAGLVLAMAAVVTLICVGLVHALLRHRDALILILALVVGIALTVGPRLIMSI
ncbi:MAG TPA: hypothetical protein H9870_04625 [Candidatus Corynebacterium avicola]|uniref:Transmembrane protein n=1 Tax=Candidatus Corynebacterium avicola TaxID=2838527 RepID=A0A9D1ULL7_9CORY|nr:hypothetical protein [Candidatus Corynebacterium avicola]